MSAVGVGVLTDQEIQEELEQESNTRLLYNPSNRYIDGRYLAHPYLLVPDGEALDIRTGKITHTDGVTPIKDRWDHDWAEGDDGKRTLAGGRKLYATSLEVVKHLMKHFPFVVRLTGDEKKDEKIKAEAKKKWVNHRLDWAKQVIAGRDEMLRAFRAEPSNAGRIPDPMSAIEIEAYEFMDQYQLGTIGRKTFVCRHDGYQTDDAEKWETHVLARHSGDVTALQGSDTKKAKKKD